MNRRARIIFLVFWIIIILLLTGYPSIPVPPIRQFPADKIAHAVIFLIMGLIQRRLWRSGFYCLLGVTVILIAEFQQLIIPGRTFEIGDILAGLVGITIPLVFTRGGTGRERTDDGKIIRRTDNGLPEA